MLVLGSQPSSSGTTVFARRHAAQLAKNTRERTERAETGFGSDFDHAHLGGDKQAAGVTDADILQKMNEVDSRVQLEALGQMRWEHYALDEANTLKLVAAGMEKETEHCMPRYGIVQMKLVKA